MARIKWATLAMATVVTLCMGTVSSATAGAFPVPKRANDRVEAFATDTYVVAFEAHEPAVVVLVGDGHTHLDLVVYDEDGNRIAADVDGGTISGAQWTPKWTGKFFIKVINRGPVYNHYRLGTN
jgi:hypothetical protein